ncbi:phosphate ABC transporter permease subunit PstC [Brevibacillus laterosporus]|uniref:phosphate ABC transporter permease subunit PstC n=1 Tax=Brevibacillus laterosporus TaxID=1465 RepID=UPI002656EB57|nr:phosphate ABC transporter permease subunit PstC [Brevibacillus laterosporus]MDN9012092.1 phosphate ABC transporter permease subunit PstC [Brevibacillus laterosporus]MDO0943163.1 phosphate ABC transporter permease subunit PstC [Brevibacillus laterosporus]
MSAEQRTTLLQQGTTVRAGQMRNSATAKKLSDRFHINKKHAWEEKAGKLITAVCAGLLGLLTLSILYFIASRGLATFMVDGVSVSQFFTGTKWDPEAEPGQFGAVAFILGSFGVTLIATLIAAPLGIGAAVYMTEIAPRFGQKVLKPVMELLVGIPSVVYGYVGLTLLVPFLRSQFDILGFSLLAGGIVLAVMILPTVTSVAADAIATVPQELRNASLALGATRWQTIRHVVLYTARSGCLTGIVLGMARAFGEALAVQMVIGNTLKLPGGLFDPSITLTSGITLNMGNTIPGTPYHNALWSMCLVLLAMSLLFILVVRLIGRKKGAK